MDNKADYTLRPLIGGMFVETSGNGFLGWPHGDESISFEKVYDFSEILKKTGLDLAVLYGRDENDKNAVTVAVKNATSVSRMILAENTDVGSLIKHAKIDRNQKDGYIIEALTAIDGQHIIIEPMTDRDSIRAMIYPIYMV
ncbi:MAG: hypothetical protein GQ477_06005 [Nanohaloarchaea archaeon]|nr:hypothetical protein [Candidatus Nanohaloarchaea archaeon]